MAVASLAKKKLVEIVLRASGRTKMQLMNKGNFGATKKILPFELW